MFMKGIEEYMKALRALADISMTNPLVKRPIANCL